MNPNHTTAKEKEYSNLINVYPPCQEMDKIEDTTHRDEIVDEE